MNNMRRLAIRMTMALAFALAPVLQTGASTVKGNVTDVNGNALTDGGWTIVAYYNDGVTPAYPLNNGVAISTIAYANLTFPPCTTPGTNVDKTVNLVYKHVATGSTRTLQGISSNCPNLDIDVKFSDVVRTTVAQGAPPALVACCEPPPSCCGASRGRLFLGRRCGR